MVTTCMMNTKNASIPPCHTKYFI